MFNWSFNLIDFIIHNKSVFPASIIVAALNMLVQNLINLVFGSKGLPKLRGYRGE